MASIPSEISLDLQPRSRSDFIDVAEKVRERDEDFFRRHRRTLLCSFHTTAGYLEEWICERLGNSNEELDRFIGLFQRVFPPDAGYHHDRMELRDELTEEEKKCEPVNADSHLTFISAGLKNCVTYENRPGRPIYFIDLDGVNEELTRTRRTTVVGFDDEELAFRGTVSIPVPSEHQVDSFNLKEGRFGLFDRLHRLLVDQDVRHGRVEIRLPPAERDAGLTVNEYETLLMRNDLPEAIRNPLRYMMQHGRRFLRNPGSIAGRTREYAVYDLLHLYNEAMDLLGAGRDVTDRILSRLSGPAFRLFRLKRSVSFLVRPDEEEGEHRIVQGTYQSPILIQHRAPKTGERELEVRLWRFR
jgi:thiamine phosphate synthase YjbQ (UPF0047 family)